MQWKEQNTIEMAYRSAIKRLRDQAQTQRADNNKAAADNLDAQADQTYAIMEKVLGEMGLGVTP